MMHLKINKFGASTKNNSGASTLLLHYVKVVYFGHIHYKLIIPISLLP